jgi:hypothetical protein
VTHSFRAIWRLSAVPGMALIYVRRAVFADHGNCKNRTGGQSPIFPTPTVAHILRAANIRCHTVWLSIPSLMIGHRHSPVHAHVQQGDMTFIHRGLGSVPARQIFVANCRTRRKMRWFVAIVTADWLCSCPPTHRPLSRRWSCRSHHFPRISRNHG